MSGNPFSQSCALAGCGQPVATAGRCALHAGQQDKQRALTSDRYHTHLYASLRWQHLRRQILSAHPWCQCPDCREQIYFPPASIVHHIRPHGGDPSKFFDPTNLQALAKSCHDRITGRSRTGGRR